MEVVISGKCFRRIREVHLLPSGHTVVQGDDTVIVVQESAVIKSEEGERVHFNGSDRIVSAVIPESDGS